VLAGLAAFSVLVQVWLATTGDRNAPATAALVLPVAFISGAAAVLSARGHFRAAALSVGGSLIVVAILVTMVHRDPSLAVTLPIIGFVICLPYVRGRALVASATVVVAAITFVAGASALIRSGPLGGIAIDVVLGGIAAATALMLFTWRLVRSREEIADRMTQFVEGVPIGIFKVGPDGRVVEVNGAAVRLLGYPDRDSLIGRLGADLAMDRPTDDQILAAVSDPAGRTGEIELRRRDGSPVWARYHVRPSIDAEGRIAGFEGALEDVTGDRIAREATARLAAWKRERIEILDALRRLSPGRTVEETAHAICAEIERGGEISYVAVFELHNGHSATVMAAHFNGRSQARSAVSQRFAATLRRQALDGPWVEQVAARSTEPGFQRLARAGLVQLALVPIEVGGDIVGLLVAGTTDPALDLGERLPTLGEFATHAAALIGPVLRARRDQKELRDRIRDTIDRAAFTPVFQPIVDLESGAILGYEALTRFDDGASTDELFADANSCGMSIALETATIQAALLAASPLPRDRFVDLNVSPELVLAEEPLRAMLRECGSNVVLEVTEHTAIADYAALRAAFATLGTTVQVAVDDAGAGYASLRHITELRPQFVKLDRGLISGIDADLIRQALITGMVHFTEGVGSMLIAEGVETDAERATLLELGVRVAQGYLFARPLPAELLQE
jgi:PAS domain S-box-containing protein